jgi:hypothetical protein
MPFSINLAAGYIRAELRERATAEETREFWEAILNEMRKQNITRVLISVRSSRSIFDVESFGLSEAMAQLAVMASVKVALVSDSSDLAAAHGYVERIAQQRGLRFKAFQGEAPAAEWLIKD